MSVVKSMALIVLSVLLSFSGVSGQTFTNCKSIVVGALASYDIQVLDQYQWLKISFIL